MPHTEIKIVRRGDPPPWDDITDDVVHLNDGHWRVALLEGGMQSGKPSVALRIDLPDGTTVVTESSLESLTGLLAAARGAFPDEFVGGPFEART